MHTWKSFGLYNNISAQYTCKITISKLSINQNLTDIIVPKKKLGIEQLIILSKKV